MLKLIYKLPVKKKKNQNQNHLQKKVFIIEIKSNQKISSIIIFNFLSIRIIVTSKSKKVL